MQLISIEVGLLFWTFYAVLALVAIIHMILNKRISTRLKFAWFLAIIFIPFIGSVLYLGKNFLVKTN